MATYNAQIILAKKILLDREHKNVLNYNNSELLGLMRDSEHFVAQADDYTFINKSDKQIRVNFSYNDCLTANYIAFINPNYANKWFFAFITEIKFYSNQMTDISFEIDNWATWFDMLEFKPCYTLREHVTDDSIGANRVEENLSVGEVDCISSVIDGGLTLNSWICVLSAWNPEDKTGYNGIAVYNGSIFGTNAYLFRNNDSGWIELVAFILQTGVDGHSADIRDMFIIPNILLDLPNLEQHNYETTFAGTHSFYTMSFSGESKKYTIPFEKKYNWQDYKPKNNKLYCYPYNYLLVSNNNGNYGIYKYEEFSDKENAILQTELSFNIGVSGRVVPINYKGMEIDDDDTIPVGKFPTCSWSSDSYTNWLTQQAINIPTQIASIGFGAVTGGIGVSGSKDVVRL